MWTGLALWSPCMSLRSLPEQKWPPAPVRMATRTVASRSIRSQASARAGYFNLAVPASMGGGGLGHLAYYAAWERIYHLCGGANWLGQFTIAHWAFGPSRVLEAVSERAATEVVAPLMAGEAMMCFGMSEPDAGSDATRIRTRAVSDLSLIHI